MKELLFHGNGLEHLPAIAISLALGLLMGLERERSPAAKAGLRTFGLVATLGALLALLSDRMHAPWALCAGLIGVAAAIIYAYADIPSGEDHGTTTQIALILCFVLGAAVWYGYATLAVIVAITMTVLLQYKPELQSMSRNLSRSDMQSMLQFAVLSFVILPVLPDRNFGPYATLNPYQIWWMVVLISGLSLAGYVALRLVGRRYGAALLGFLGGMVSSTVTTLVYARHGRDSSMKGLAVTVILIANLVVLVRLSALSGVLAPGILPRLLPIVACGLIAGSAAALHAWQRMSRSQEPPMPEVRNPTEIKVALSFAVFYAVILLAAAWLSDIAGRQGLYLLSFISGLTDVDAISLSSLRLYGQGKLLADNVVTAMALAYFANTLFKLGLLTSAGGKQLALAVAPGMAAAAAGVGLGLLIF